MGIVRDLYYARKMSAGLKLPAPTVALLIKRLRLAAAMGGDITKTVSGSPAHITDALAKAALSVLVNITPIQPGSGDPAPDNVRPISGLTGLSVYRRSANLLNAATNITGKYIGYNGSISNGDDAQYTDLIPVKSGELYVCSLVSGRNSGNNRWLGYNENGTWVKQLAYISASGQQGNKLVMAATIDSGISYVRLSYGITDTEAMVCAFSKEISWEGYHPVARYSSQKVSIDQSTVIQSPYTAQSNNTGPAVLFEVEQGKVYGVISTVTADNSFGLRATFYSSKDDVNNVAKGIWSTSISEQSRGFVPVSGAAYAVISCTGAKGTTFTFDANSIKVYCGEADYQPYGYDEYPCDWSTQAGTVYGGTLDVVTGQLTVDWAAVTYNGTESWTKATGQNAFYVELNTMVRPADKTYIGKIICDKLQTCIGSSISDFVSAENGVTGYIGDGYLGQNWLYAKADGATTAAAFKAWLADNPIQVVYNLATPLTYQLTPQEVQMLLGENYVWSSSGDTVSVTYYAEGNANTLQSLNILLGGNYSNPKTADDVSDKEALEIILGGNK